MTLEIDFMKPAQEMSCSMYQSAIQLAQRALETLNELRKEIAELRRLRVLFASLDIGVFTSTDLPKGSVIFGLEEARQLENLIFK